MPKRAVPLLLAVVALALPAFAAAQRPLTVLLPDTTVLAVEVTPEPFPPGIDTPEDLQRAEAYLASVS